MFVIIGLVFAVLTALAPTLTIHANRGGDGSSSSSGGSGFGHAWLVLKDDNGNEVPYGTAKKQNEPVDLQRDEDVESESSSSWQINEEQAEFIRQYALGEVGDYDFIDNNCTDLVEMALFIAVGPDIPNFDTLGISDPSKLADWLDTNPWGAASDSYGPQDRSGFALNGVVPFDAKREGSDCAA